MHLEHICTPIEYTLPLLVKTQKAGKERLQAATITDRHSYILLPAGDDTFIFTFVLRNIQTFPALYSGGLGFKCLPRDQLL
jgi:hypothetical protein